MHGFGIVRVGKMGRWTRNEGGEITVVGNGKFVGDWEELMEPVDMTEEGCQLDTGWLF